MKNGDKWEKLKIKFLVFFSNIDKIFNFWQRLDTQVEFHVVLIISWNFLIFCDPKVFLFFFLVWALSHLIGENALGLNDPKVLSRAATRKVISIFLWILLNL